MEADRHADVLTDSPTDMLTATEAAALLNVSDMTIRRWISNGVIQASKRGRSWQINRTEVERVLGDPNTDRPTVDDTPTDSSTDTSVNRQTSATGGPNWEMEQLRTKLSIAEEENGRLESEVSRMGVDLERIQRQFEEALGSVRALTEQNERLTLLLANEQVQRMKAQPKPFGWVRRLLGRREEAQTIVRSPKSYGAEDGT